MNPGKAYGSAADGSFASRDIDSILPCAIAITLGAMVRLSMSMTFASTCQYSFQIGYRFIAGE